MVEWLLLVLLIGEVAQVVGSAGGMDTLGRPKRNANSNHTHEPEPNQAGTTELNTGHPGDNQTIAMTTTSKSTSGPATETEKDGSTTLSTVLETTEGLTTLSMSSLDPVTQTTPLVVTNGTTQEDILTTELVPTPTTDTSRELLRLL